jgi:hypothetical protein
MKAGLELNPKLVLVGLKKEQELELRLNWDLRIFIFIRQLIQLMARALLCFCHQLIRIV